MARSKNALSTFQVSSPTEVIDLLLHITKRCFSKIIVAVLLDSTNPEQSGQNQTSLDQCAQIKTSPDNSGLNQTSPNESGQIKTSPGNSGLNQTSPDDSGQIQTSLDQSGQIQTSPNLSELEQTGLTGLLQMLESVYQTDIWEILGVVGFHDKSIGNFFTYKSYYLYFVASKY